MEQVKTMYYISKVMEEAFSKITFGAAKYMVTIPKYRNQYKNEIRKIKSMVQKEKKKQKIKEKEKQKQDKNKQKQQQSKEKQEWRRQKQREKQREKQQKQRQRQQEKLKKLKEKQKQKKESEKKKGSSSSSSKSMTSKSASVQNKKPECPSRWSYLAPKQQICSKPQCYKIARVNEFSSDYEHQKNPFKVPEYRPRQPLTPFFLFLRANRNKFEEQIPNNKNLLKLLKKIWKNLSHSEKSIYETQYKRAYEIYQRKFAEYKKAHPEEEQKEQEKQNKKKKDDEDNDKEKGKNRESEKKTRGGKKSGEKKEGGRGKSKGRGKSIKDHSAKSIFDNMKNLNI